MFELNLAAQCGESQFSRQDRIILQMKKALLAITLSLLVGCSQKTSEEHLSAARQYVQQQNLEAAVVELKNAIQLEPRSATARFELGSLYLEQNDYDSAEKELNRALEYGHPASEVIPLLSRAYKRTGAYAALSEIDHNEEGLSSESEAEVGFFKLQSLIQLNKKLEAEALITELEASETDSIYKGLAIIHRPILALEYEQALSELIAVIEAHEPNADALKIQGQLLLQLQRPAEAADVYQDYVKLYPEDKQTLFILSKILVDSGRMEEANPHVDALLEINAENALLNQLKATILAAESDFSGAQSYAEKAIANGRGDPVLRLIAGYAAYQLQDFEASSRHLSYIASSLPDNHPGLKMLAASQLQTGQSVEAGDVLDRINQESEQDALLFSKTGYELIRSGNYNQAKELVERTSFISRTAEDLTRLGVLKLSLNDVQGIVNLEQALEQAPELKSAKSTLATAYIATNQLDKAAALAKEWQTTDPTEIEGYMLAAEVYVRQQKNDAAREQYAKVLELQSDNTLAKLALVNVDILEDKNEKAESALDKILADKPEFTPALATYFLLKKKQGMSDQGLKPAERAVKASPSNIQNRILLARMYSAEQRWESAVSITDSVTANEEAPISFWQARGQALLRSNNVEGAEEHYSKWLKISPNSKEAVLGQLLLLDSQNKFDDGLKLVNGFLEKRQDSQMEVLQIHFQIMTKDFKTARKGFDSLSENALALPIIQGFAARLLLAEGKADEALPYAQESYEGITNSRNLIVLLSALEKNNKKQQGLALLQSHVKAQPNDLAAKMLLAERQIGSSESDAISTYEASLKLNPDNFIVLNNLAYLYLSDGRVSEAKKHAERAVEIRPENAAALDTLAQVLVAEEDYDEALKYYDRAVSDSMRNEEIYLNYVEVLLKTDQTRLAKRKLEQRDFSEATSEKRIADFSQKYGI
jgi:putative PEP-CTERM system TPR-repeat lipoprotein